MVKCYNEHIRLMIFYFSCDALQDYKIKKKKQ